MPACPTRLTARESTAIKSRLMRPAKQTSAAAAERAARELYAELLRSWNGGNAATFARAFTRSGNVVGFDGSQVNGQEEIESHLAKVFASHKTSAYVGKVREVRVLGREVVLLRAVAGMVPPGGSDINPQLNTVHTLVAANQGDRWLVELFQATPAAFHGRPEASERLTAELREELRASEAGQR
jgi:uncharacterized protein (TIGR02246 family)